MVQTEGFASTEYLQQLRDQIDVALESYTDFSSDCPQTLAEAIRYSLLSGGKRLRPALVLLAAEACGGDRGAALPAACAVEMIHAYSLIHDDLPAMDDDDLRRGRPTCHKEFGEATAIRAGDALLALAFEVLAGGIEPPATAARCTAVLAQAAGPTALVGGQAADLAGEFEEGDIDALMAIHRRKTGAIFLAALQLGGLVAGADDEQLAALDIYGTRLGLAFQITDDLLDVAGDEATVGKRVGKDAGHGKITFPSVLGVEESRRHAEQLIDEALEAVAIFGEKAVNLTALGRFVLERNR